MYQSFPKLESWFNGGHKRNVVNSGLPRIKPSCGRVFGLVFDPLVWEIATS